MNPLVWRLTLTFLVPGAGAQAATVWNGPTVTFSKSAVANPRDPGSQDRLTPNVWLTRADIQGPYNAKVENGFTHGFSPADTEWANGKLADYATLTYVDWNSWAKHVNLGPPATVGLDAVVHLISEDIYVGIKFTSWGMGAGNFSYERSSPGASPPPVPSVALMFPAEGNVFAAPATVTLSANASVSGGTVTNVAFFDGVTLLGSAQAPPFTFVAALAPGSHPLTAVAAAGGITSTSSVVHVSVVTPKILSISSPVSSGGAFSFTYATDAGLRYLIERASSLNHWSPIATNTAAGDVSSFSEPATAGEGRFYRVGRLPNPSPAP